jgi:hypothetical protein
MIHDYLLCKLELWQVTTAPKSLVGSLTLTLNIIQVGILVHHNFADDVNYFERQERTVPGMMYQWLAMSAPMPTQRDMWHRVGFRRSLCEVIERFHRDLRASFTASMDF